MSQSHRLPSTPRIISPSPTSSELGDGPGNYFAPATRSATKRAAVATVPVEQYEEEKVNISTRSRARSRTPPQTRRRRQSDTTISRPIRSSSLIQKSEPLPAYSPSKGHLSPSSAGSSYFKELSRSPSPRLIPIHRSWRSFIHRHEIPRKFLHVSIGFFTLQFYASGLQPADIHPWLLGAFIPIASVDILRHNFQSFNRIYVRVLGALMRESEVNDKYNGVIFYILGAWISLRFFPKDVGVMSVLLLSWCDTAASTFGRLYGRYTPKIRKGKSLAGSAAAALMGVFTSALFLGALVPHFFGYEDSFVYKGCLSAPRIYSHLLGLDPARRPNISGTLALGIMSLWSGLVASASELVDVFGIDDNLTIPVLSGIGIWGFAKVFG